MSINPLNNISRVYLNQISEAVDQDGDNDNDFADVRIARMIASGVPKEVAIQKTKNKSYNKKSKSVKEELVGGQTKIDVAAPYGKLTSADFKELRKGKKKVTKEGYSNWREDLAEVMTDVQADKKITEKKVNNKININPKLDLGEAVENLGGTLLEMVEIDEVDYIIESVYDELLDEGYEEDDIEEALEYALVEAKVTFGHDTDKPYEHKKKSGVGNLVKAVGRLARQNLSSKYRGAKKAAAGAIVSGARQVARGALGVARKMEGDKKPSPVHSRAGTRSPSVHRGAGVGQRERVSSGSYSAPKPETPKSSAKPEQRKTSTPVTDPWEGSATTPPKKSAPKPQAKTPEPKSDEGLSARQKAAAIRAQRRNINISPEDLKRVIGNVKEDYWISAAKGYKEQYEILEKAESEQQQKLFGLALSVKRGQTSRDKVSDKVLEIVDSMSEKKIRDFAKTPHKGLPKKVQTKEDAIKEQLLSRMIAKIDEQAMELQPKTQQQSGQQNTMQKKDAQQKDRQKQQEVQILQRKLQALRSAPKGVDTDITA